MHADSNPSCATHHYSDTQPMCTNQDYLVYAHATAAHANSGAMCTRLEYCLHPHADAGSVFAQYHKSLYANATATHRNSNPQSVWIWLDDSMYPHANPRAVCSWIDECVYANACRYAYGDAQPVRTEYRSGLYPNAWATHANPRAVCSWIDEYVYANSYSAANLECATNSHPLKR